MQRVLIDGWLKAAVAADVEFSRFCDRAITHAPGRMLVCDPLSRDFRDERGVVD